MYIKDNCNYKSKIVIKTLVQKEEAVRKSFQLL